MLSCSKYTWKIRFNTSWNVFVSILLKCKRVRSFLRVEVRCETPQCIDRLFLCRLLGSLGSSALRADRLPVVHGFAEQCRSTELRRAPRCRHEAFHDVQRPPMRSIRKGLVFCHCLGRAFACPSRTERPAGRGPRHSRFPSRKHRGGKYRWILIENLPSKDVISRGVPCLPRCPRAQR